MPNGGVGASSFEFYEGIRIFVPGAIASGLYVAIGETFDFPVGLPTTGVLGALLAALVTGIVLLFIDAPSKSAAYNSRLPSDELGKWGVTPPHGSRVQNIFFTMLDEIMPASIRDRSLDMGSIFRIGFEGIYMAAVASIAVMTLILLFPLNGPTVTRAMLCEFSFTRLPLFTSLLFQLPYYSA